jgi:hypothetical protein
MQATEVLLAWSAGQTAWQDLALWWILPFGLFYAIVGSRLFAEFEHNWLSRALLVLTGACYIGSLVLWLPDLTFLRPEWKGQVSETVQLVGHLLLTLAIAAEARKVVQEVQHTARISTAIGRSRQRSQNLPGVIAVDPAQRHPAGTHFSSAHQISGELTATPGRWNTGNPQEFAQRMSEATTGVLALPNSFQDSSSRGPSANLPTEDNFAEPTAETFTAGTSRATLRQEAVSRFGAPGALQGTEVSRPTPPPTVADSAGNASQVTGLAPEATTAATTQSSPPATNSSGIRKLTKAEKKAIRKRLEELRAARERRLQEKQGNPPS